jgi:type IV secretory pathway TraG/TraD family ATPase VirD4
MKPNTNSKTIHLHGVTIPREWIQSHLFVVGATGTGKSRGILRPIIAQTLSQGDAAVIFDPKGDLLGIVREALNRCGRTRDLITLGTGENDLTFNPLADPQLLPHQVVNQLVQCASLTGQALSQRSGSEDLFWSTARIELLCALIELGQKTVADSDEKTSFTFIHLQRLRRQLSQPHASLLRWAGATAELLSENSATSLLEFASLPDPTRACVLTSASNLIAPFLRPPLAEFVLPTAKRPSLRLPDIINHSKVVVVTAAQAEQVQDIWTGFLLFKQALYRLVMARSRLPVRQDNQLLVCLDEYNRLILAPDSHASEHVVMESARAAKTSFILAAQNVSGLEAVGGGVITDKLAALAGNVCFLANSCPATARLAQRVLGTRKTLERHEAVTPLPPPPLLFPEDRPPAEHTVTSTVLVPTEIPVMTAAELSRLPTGSAHLKLVDGSIHKIQCAFD